MTGGTRNRVRLVPQEERFFSLTEQEAERVELSVQFSTLEYAPVLCGAILGEVTVLLDGQLLGSVPMIAERECAAKTRSNNGLFSRLFGSAGK